MDSDKHTAVDEMYAGTLVHFRKYLNNDGYESAEDFIMEVLPYLDLMLERIAEELDTARKNHLTQMLESKAIGEEQYRKRLRSPARYTVSLDEISGKVSNMLEDIRNGKSRRASEATGPGETGRRTIESAVPVAQMSHNSRSSGYPRDGYYMAPAPAQAKVFGSAGEDVRRTEAIIPEVLPPMSPEERRMAAASAAAVHRTSAAEAQSRKVSMASSSTTTRSVYGGSNEARVAGVSQPQQPQQRGTAATYQEQPRTQTAPDPGVIRADSSLTKVDANICAEGSSRGYHIVQKGEVKKGGQYGSSYSATAPQEAQSQVGRYSQGASSMEEVVMTVEDEGYSMRDIDKYIRYADQYRKQGYYDRAMEFLILAKELPEFYLYDYYRDEILDLEDKIERSRVGGAPVGVSNVVSHSKFNSFDYISKKGKAETWVKEAD